MPEGWNPSDDSEDEYRPGEKKGGRKRDKNDTSSEDESKSKKTKVVRKAKAVATPGASSSVTKSVKTDPDAVETDSCVICQEKIKRSGVKGNTSLR